MSSLEDRSWQKIRRYLTSNQPTAARIALQSLVQRAPTNVEARVMLAGAILSEEHLVRETAEQLHAALKVLPEDADRAAMVALAMLRVGEIVGARACMTNPDIARTTSVENLMSLAHVHQLLGEHEKSLELMNRAKSLGHDNSDFRYFRAVQLQFNGRLDEAEKELESCLNSGPTFGRASYTLARLRRQTAERNHIPYIREQLLHVERQTEDHASFEFAQFKELEDIGDYENAWSALERGNAIMERRLQPDIAQENELFDSLIANTTTRSLDLGHGQPDGPVPIFVIGMPRSGTTVLERILGNHSMIESAGELSDFPRQMQWQANHYSFPVIDRKIIARVSELDYRNIGKRYLEQTQWRARGKPYYVDKLPPNFMLAGFIRRALPQSPILHMVRDPMDAYFSNWKAMFGDAYAYSYNRTALASHYRNYRRLMRHWHSVMPYQIMDIDYNELVRNADAKTREILAHCKIPYEDGCTDLSRNITPIATMSSMQTRGAINDSSIGEWRRYAAKLDATVSAFDADFGSGKPY